MCDRSSDPSQHDQEAGGVVPDSLDAAWREAEAALPTGWRFAMLRKYGDTFEAWVINAEGTLNTPGIPGTGRTPTAALQALAAKLRRTP